MKIILSLLFFLAASSAHAGGPFYVSTTGLDSNNGLTLSTAFRHLQKPADACAQADACTVYIAAGTYDGETVNIAHFKTLSYQGPLNTDGTCPSPTAVVITDNHVASTLFWGQDHVTLTINCMYLYGYNTSTNGFMTRQFSIGDVDNVWCGQMSVCIAATEASKINVYNPGLYGNGSRWAEAADNSVLFIGGSMTTDGPVFGVSVITALFNSDVNVTLSSLSGGATGYQYQCLDSVIVGASLLPGSGAYPGSDDCHLR